MGALKDTFVTHTFARADEEPGRRDELIAFAVRQTGVREDTLRRHYERWWPRDREKIDRTYGLLDPGLAGTRNNCPPRGDNFGGLSPKMAPDARKRPEIR